MSKPNDSSVQNRPERTRSNDSRAAWWALAGVGVGFLLPIVTCIGVVLVGSLGFGQLLGEGGTAGTLPTRARHVSGPPTGPAVALLDLEGPIVSGRTPTVTSTSMTAADDLIPLIERADQDPDVRAIVLRVDSPGGSVVPSDRIYTALKGVDVPVVVMMEDIAASGGLYVSMAGDYVLANPSTLTGSIGVISQFPNARELLEKLGVEMTIIKSGEFKDAGSSYRPMEPSERQHWQEIIDRTHDRFVSVVVESRGLSEEEVREFADGRILLAGQAIELGLIDGTGYERDAIDEAAELGGITGEPRVVEYQRAASLLDFLSGAPLPNGLSLLEATAGLQRELFAPTLSFRWIP